LLDVDVEHERRDGFAQRFGCRAHAELLVVLELRQVHSGRDIPEGPKVRDAKVSRPKSKDQGPIEDTGAVAEL
jgi:hypothetical protein